MTNVQFVSATLKLFIASHNCTGYFQNLKDFVCYIDWDGNIIIMTDLLRANAYPVPGSAFQ